MFGRSKPVVFDPYRGQRSRFGLPRWLLLLLLGGVLGAAGVLYVQQAWLPPRLSAAETATLRQAYQQADAERTRLASELELANEGLRQAQAAVKHLGADAGEATDTLRTLRADLDLVIDALPPDPRAGAVAVRAGRISARGGQLAYSLVLTREKAGAKPIDGVLQIVVVRPGRAAGGRRGCARSGGAVDRPAPGRTRQPAAAGRPGAAPGDDPGAGQTRRPPARHAHPSRRLKPAPGEAMPTQIDYYFTPVSPWTHLGHARFARLLRDTASDVNVYPVDYGVIFPASGGLPLGKRAPQRQAYRLVELARFSQALGVPLNVQPAHFPVSADLASRLIVATGLAQGAPASLDLAGRLGAAVWAEERDVADPSTLAQVLAEAGLAADLLAQADTPQVAARYAAGTQQALDAGVFGAPSYVIDGEIFWGQDRLDFVERRLRA